MKTVPTTGLGEPEIVGKKTLFQPPRMRSKSTTDKSQTTTGESKRLIKADPRIRTSIKLTKSAIEIIQKIQTGHRIKTGKVLPLWQLICQAIEVYGESKTKNNDES